MTTDATYFALAADPDPAARMVLLDYCEARQLIAPPTSSSADVPAWLIRSGSGSGSGSGSRSGSGSGSRSH